MKKVNLNLKKAKRTANLVAYFEIFIRVPRDGWLW